MRKLALAAVLVLLAAGGAEAASAKRVVLKTGDAVDVVGTAILCQATVGKTVIKGKRLIGCLLANAKGPIPGTFGAALAADGEVAAVQVSPAREAVRIFRRTLASVASSSKPRLVKVGVGDSFDLSGTDIGCAVVEDDGKPLVVCLLKRPDGKEVRAKTYGIAFSDNVAAIVWVPAAGKTQIVFQRRQPA